MGSIFQYRSQTEYWEEKSWRKISRHTFMPPINAMLLQLRLAENYHRIVLPHCWQLKRPTSVSRRKCWLSKMFLDKKRNFFRQKKKSWKAGNEEMVPFFIIRWLKNFNGLRLKPKVLEPKLCSNNKSGCHNLEPRVPGFLQSPHDLERPIL